MKFKQILLILIVSCYIIPTNAHKKKLPYTNVYHTYFYKNIKDSPAPKGYKPFYINHIGRHGSRFPVDYEYVNRGLKILERGDSMQILTDDGKRMLEGFKRLDSISEGQYGMLCELGMNELQGIGNRMANRFAEVFNNPDRNFVHAISTEKQRAIVSGANFCIALAKNHKDLQFSYKSGKKYTDLLCNDATPMVIKGIKAGGKASDKYMEENFPYDSFYGRIFTKPEKIYPTIRTKRLLAESVFANGSVAYYLGINEILDATNENEFKEASIAYNNKMYYEHCNGKEQGNWRIHEMDNLLYDFLNKAKEALKKNSNIAANLRFSHDTGMMPFFSLIGLKGFEKVEDFNHSGYNIWNGTESMCMGTNLQMVFYRNIKDDILVKVLHNETETTFPLLDPDYGVYYKWERLKDYFIQRLNYRK